MPIFKQHFVCILRGSKRIYVIAVKRPSCEVLINKENPIVTYYYVLILNLNLKYIINFLKVISISKEYFI